eukprot:CAMPEP_0196733022 /NCGR_PEP_ID=MMETSP1091-20130531/12243_1 /TAXON_ID=302021 /ORGANISM="Rhodomonas sp., Strain CCMP768" /LENGTH=180 /DNA_ID=CAMNT_0042076365 /DNA_START=64 /DNA_END=606 /DNA_ORIENTATION=+
MRSSTKQVAIAVLATLQLADCFMLQPLLPGSRSFTHPVLRSSLMRTASSCRAPRAEIAMAADGESAGKDQDRRGAGVAVLDVETETAPAEEKEERDAEFEGNWRVLLHRDEWLTLDYGQEAIMTVVPMIPHQKAHRIAMRAHMEGVAHVITAPGPMAREFSLAFKRLGFTSSIAPSGNAE